MRNFNRDVATALEQTNWFGSGWRAPVIMPGNTGWIATPSHRPVKLLISGEK
jgi:hypothetical protein